MSTPHQGEDSISEPPRAEDAYPRPHPREEAVRCFWVD
jgi:hypothetical protein